MAEAVVAETVLARLVREQGRFKGWVAEQIGCDRQRMALLLKGERDLTVVEAAKLAVVFGVPVETFVPAGAKRGE